jgi:hypothetical protein
MDRAGGLSEARLVRVTFEILRPIPISTLQVEAEVVRPGRSVELIEGTLSTADTPLIRARAWRIRTEDLTLDADPPAEEAPPGPDRAQEQPFFDTGVDAGHHTAMDVRFVSGGYREPGPAVAWFRMRVPLVEGEEIEPRDRVLVAADSGNGVSAPLDYHRWLFINADLNVALRRPPRGEWVCLDATTWTEPDGIGLTDTALYDEKGIVGRATQSLLLAERGG